MRSVSSPRGTLIRVVAPHFVAGLVIDDNGYCGAAAPILAWSIGQGATDLSAYFKRKGWEARIVK